MSAAESHGIDDYLGAVYELVEEGAPAVQARIARRLGVTRASVSEQISKLRGMGMIEPGGRDLVLTVRGYAVAEEQVRRHRMTERFLTDVLKMPWHLAHEEAGRFQTGLTPAIEARILEMLGTPAFCPHGNPVPGTGAVVDRDARPLSDFAPGDRVVLVRLLEDVELDTDVLRYLEEHGLIPDARIHIDSANPDGSMTLRVGDTSSSLGPKLTDNVWVRAAPAT
ncbi:MAG: metal-dependent transcriptional regulator [Actinomycetota bacterium]